VAVSFVAGGNRSTQINHQPVATILVMSTDYKGNCKFNYNYYHVKEPVVNLCGIDLDIALTNIIGL
jgi:hypothetical protein